MKYPKLTKGYSQYGAYMGRANWIEEPDEPIKFHLYRMPMSACGCYDSGGAYWGAGDHKIGWMYHAYGDGPLWFNQVFVRAKSREEAKRLVREHFKNARFYC